MPHQSPVFLVALGLAGTFMQGAAAQGFTPLRLEYRGPEKTHTLDLARGIFLRGAVVVRPLTYSGSAGSGRHD